MATDPRALKAAHWTISNATRSGKLPKANTLLCSDCGRPAGCYDHYLGYAKENRFAVQPVCFSCHNKRMWARGEMVATPEWRAQIRERMRGNKHSLGIKRSEEFKRAVGDRTRGKPGYFLGKKFSAEHRAKISAAKKGCPAPWAVEVGKRNKGRKWTDEQRAKILAIRKGSKRSEEIRRKMSEARKRWWAVKHSCAAND